MGEVYCATDPSDGKDVAVKVLARNGRTVPTPCAASTKRPDCFPDVNNPYVANFLEINEDDGLHYIVLEFVAGCSLQSVLQDVGLVR